MMQYDKTFKEEALRLSDEIGLKNAAAQLGIFYYTLSGWRNKRTKKENAELKRSNEILQEALGFFAVRRKK